MAIRTIPLSSLVADPRGTLNECANSGDALVVQLPDQRLVAIQSLDAGEDDDLVNELIASNAAFRDLLTKSKAGTRTPFRPTRS